ncbi:MAG: putative PEP-binding protein, partial [candidate division NC10 bacterium]
TADLGGDRIAHLGFETPKSEANPFLGLRGIRLFLRHPDLLKTQFRAILRSSAHGKVRIMLPMVSALREIQEARRVFQQAAQELTAEGVQLPKKIEMGIMVEVPAAALTLDTLLDEADFVSIGTNDLIQYVLAVDRVNEDVAHLYDPFHPAVLKLLRDIVETAHRRAKTVSVCGEMASDPKAAPLLVGLGVDSLSVSARMFLRIKQIVRRLNMGRTREAVRAALGQVDSDAVRKTIMSIDA